MVSFDGVVKLCDFGIAKAAAIGDQLTNPGQVKGKYAYMSPEQTIGSPLDGRSDVFSLVDRAVGAAHRQADRPRADAVEAMRAIRDGRLEPIARAAPHTPPALAEAIEWGLETSREGRATAIDLAQALEAFIKSAPDIATPMQLGAWVRQRFTRDSTGEVTPAPARPAPGTEIASVTPDSDTAVTVALVRPRLSETEILAAANDSSIAPPPPTPQPPPAVVQPTAIVDPLPMRKSQRKSDRRAATRLAVRRQRTRRIIAIVGLVVLAVVSFLIALAVL